MLKSSKEGLLLFEPWVYFNDLSVKGLVLRIHYWGLLKSLKGGA